MPRWLKLTLIAVALLLVGGSASAASRWVITSTHQIKPSVLKQLHGARGPRGAAGAPGPAGATGSAGGFSTANVVETTGPPASMCPASGGVGCSVNGSFASCPPGSVALGGGYSGPVTSTTVAFDYPIGNGTAWDVIMSNESSIAESFTPYVVCAVGSAPAVRDGSAVQAQATANVAAARSASP